MQSMTSKARSVVEAAHLLAKSLQNQHFLPLHLLKGFIDQDGGWFSSLAHTEGIPLKVLSERTAKALERLPKVEGGGDSLYMSSDMARVLSEAEKLSKEQKDAFISLDTLFLGLLSMG